MGRALRRAAGGLLTGLLLLAAAAFYLYAPESGRSGRGPAESAEPAPSPPGTASPEPTTLSDRTPSTAPDGPPPRSGDRDASMRLVARVTPGGAFDVVETVRLAAPVRRLVLEPFDPTPAGGVLRSVRPVVRDLRVTADGRSTPPRTDPVRGTTVLRLREPARRFVLRYRLEGTTVRSRRSEPGRALAAVAPLASSVPSDLPVTAVLPGRAVLNLSCPALPPEQRSCYDGPRPDVRVNRTLARREALVVLQLDLQAGR